MQLDKDFAREVKKIANGDGSREARFAFLNPAREAAKKLSSPNVMREFSDAIRQYGRVVVAICVAVTVLERRDRLEWRTVLWAEEVIKLWSNRPSSLLSLYIDDGLHPTRIEEYAGSFIRLTTERPMEG